MHEYIYMMEPIVNEHEGLENIEKMERKEWIIELYKDLENIGAGLISEYNVVRKRSIYRLPEHVTNRHKEAYKPQVVSIGPYHNGEGPLQAMERHKLRALYQVIHRSGIPIELYVNQLEEIIKELREAYDDLDDKWKEDNSKFLRMMILDGCFILEILLGNFKQIYAYDDDVEKGLLDEYDHCARYGRLFSKREKIYVETFVRRDMLLIENQVPLLLLEKILYIEGSPFQDEDLSRLILKFCSPDVTPFKEDGIKCLHILDAYRKSLISKLVRTANTGISRSGPHFYERIRHIPGFIFELSQFFYKRNNEKDHIRHVSATEIREAGIKFKRVSEVNQIMSLEGTTLRLPKVFLDDASKSTFLNIMAFERFHENAGNELTTYIFFKNKLITSVSDVRLLKEEEIIYHSLGSDEDVVQLFYQLSREITLDSNTSLDKWYRDISNNINNYYCSNISTCRKWKYNLMSTYFKSPWTLISVLAATSILCLTAAQTIYTILSYGNRETSVLPP